MATVYLADRHAPYRRQLAHALRRRGTEVIEFASGAELFARTVECEPDLVVTETELDEVDGFQVFAWLRRRRSPTRAIPIVFHTRFDNPSVAHACKQQGALDYIGKNQPLEQVVEKIQALMIERDPLETRNLMAAVAWLQSRGKSGRLDVSICGEHGHILLHKGRVIEARLNALLGEQALELFAQVLPGASFHFAEGVDELGITEAGPLLPGTDADRRGDASGPPSWPLPLRVEGAIAKFAERWEEAKASGSGQMDAGGTPTQETETGSTPAEEASLRVMRRPKEEEGLGLALLPLSPTTEAASQAPQIPTSYMRGSSDDPRSKFLSQRDRKIAATVVASLAVGLAVAAILRPQPGSVTAKRSYDFDWSDRQAAERDVVGSASRRALPAEVPTLLSLAGPTSAIPNRGTLDQNENTSQLPGTERRAPRDETRASSFAPRQEVTARETSPLDKPARRGDRPGPELAGGSPISTAPAREATIRGRTLEEPSVIPPARDAVGPAESDEGETTAVTADPLPLPATTPQENGARSLAAGVEPPRDDVRIPVPRTAAEGLPTSDLTAAATPSRMESNAAAPTGDLELANKQPDSPPTLASPLRFRYPPELSADRARGAVTVRALVGASGQVEVAQVIGSSGNLKLDAAAIEAVRAASFHPARRAEKPVPAWIEQRVLGLCCRTETTSPLRESPR